MEKGKKRTVRRDKTMAARVNGPTYEKFTRINEIRGIPNSSAINLWLVEYVREYEHLLTD